MDKSSLETLEKYLGEEKLKIADVGATGGPEKKWSQLLPFCHFYTFDPDPRAVAWTTSATNFPIGLWSKKCEKTLHLLLHPEASSVFEIDRTNIDAFKNAFCHTVVGKEKIALDTLDHALKEKQLDFLKIDTEGAELEVLKGGKESLKSCLGIQAEAAFISRHKGAPLFSELELFLREYGFQVFQIQREHWIREKGIMHLNTAPQLVWGNALFLLSEEELKKRLAESKEPEKLLTKYFLILYAYRLHDYAYALCETYPDLKKIIEKAGIPPKRHFLSLIKSLCAGGLRYLFTFSKRRRKKRRGHLILKMRALGNACLSVGRSEFAVYDDE